MTQIKQTSRETNYNNQHRNRNKNKNLHTVFTALTQHVKGKASGHFPMSCNPQPHSFTL